MQWQIFFGACLLTGAIVMPHAGVLPVLAGMMLAALVQLTWSRISVRRRERRR